MPHTFSVPDLKDTDGSISLIKLSVFLNQVQNDVEHLQNHEQRLEQLITKLDSAEKVAGNATASVSALRDEIHSLKEICRNLQTAISQFNERYSAHEIITSQVEKKIADLVQDVTAINRSLSTKERQITAVVNRLTTVETQQTEVLGSITTLSNKTEENHKEIDRSQTYVKAGILIISIVGAGIAALVGAWDWLRAALTSMK